MTKEDFLKFHSGYFGEQVDDVKQIALITFNGEELFEYLQEFVIETAPMFEGKVVKSETRFCDKCKTNQATILYSGDGFMMCNTCYDKISDELDELYD